MSSTTVGTTGTGDSRRAHRGSGHYVIDAARTRVEVGVRLAGLPVWGAFDTLQGAFEIPADLTVASARLRVVAGSLSCGSRRRNRLAAAVLDVETHAAIDFEAERMEPILESFVTHDGDRPLWALVGTLTVRGIARPVRIAVGVVRPTADGSAVEFTGTTIVRCSEFGLGRGGGLIGDIVRVRINAVAERDSA
ncbi:hypothetical protein BH23ACT10_BH23ACT10_24690 [soil metagenome]